MRKRIKSSIQNIKSDSYPVKLTESFNFQWHRISIFIDSFILYFYMCIGMSKYTLTANKCTHVHWTLKKKLHANTFFLHFCHICEIARTDAHIYMGIYLRMCLSFLSSIWRKIWRKIFHLIELMLLKWVR